MWKKKIATFIQAMFGRVLVMEWNQIEWEWMKLKLSEMELKIFSPRLGEEGMKSNGKYFLLIWDSYGNV